MSRISQYSFGFQDSRTMLKNQTNITFLADDNGDGEKLDMFFMFSTFCFIVTAVGEAMVIYYIARYASKERAINKLVLIDQVCKTHKEVYSTYLFYGLKYFF